MITETGKNLSILIITEDTRNWQTFATWYSIYKNLPEAKVAIISHRTAACPFVYFQWTKRLKVPTIHRAMFKEDQSKALNWLHAIKEALDRKYVEYPCLIIDSSIMAIDVLDQKFLDFVNNNDSWSNGNIWYMKNQKIDDIIQSYYVDNWTNPPELQEDLFMEAKDAMNLCSFVSCKKGCGRWIDTSKGCPFSSAGGLISEDMTVNETRINNLWKKMVPLYNSVV